MRIQASFKSTAKSLLINSTKKLPLTLAGIAVLAGGVLLFQNFTSVDEAVAVTPPDSCFAFNSTTATITDYYDNEADNPANPACPREVDIPSSIGGVAVTVIGDQAFRSNQLTSVTIPSSITSIGELAFANNQLTSATISDSVTTIKRAAFWRNQLTSITIPSALTTVGESVFAHNQLTSITIPSSVTLIGDYAFSDNLLTSITIPSSVTSLGEGTFQSNELTSVTISSSVTAIGASAFRFNQLTSVDIPNSVTSLGEMAFDSNKLTSITIPDSITNINKYTFRNNKLASVTIPNSVTSIGEAAFISNKLTTVIIPSSVTNIDNDAFRSNQLTSVTIPNSVTTIGDSAFYGNKLTSLTISNSVTTTGRWTFSGNQLTSVNIPDSVTTIGDGAFEYNQLTSINIKDSITTIGAAAFRGNKLTSVDIPDSVTAIGDKAFYRNSIATAYVGSGITSLPSSVFAAQVDLDKWGGDTGSWEDSFYGGDLADVEKALASGFFTRVYTTDPTNPNGLKSSIYLETLLEVDDDGDWDDIAMLGGYLVNPADVEIKYRDTTNQTVALADRLTGINNTTGSKIDNYYLSDLPEFTMPSDNQTWPSPVPTPAEQASIDAALASYFTLGDSTTITPPAVSGYITPPARTVNLDSANNQVTFVYNKPLTTVDFSTYPTSDSVPSSLPLAMRNSVFSVSDTGGCSSIESAKLLPADGFTAPDVTTTPAGTIDYTTLGGLDFTLTCTSPGNDASVSLALAGTISDTSLVKVYKKTSTGATDITGQVTVTNQDGKTIISYDLTDGGALDDDDVTNGTITDPVYITVPSSDPILQDSDTTADDEDLADTGSNLWLVATAASMMIAGAGVAVKMARR